ncbi:DUF4307 domain-containing protein [Leifsonia poae]|uniref:DUF4307 domain-containing protein n=1 Tax=Leifsonia poae TaxID=110933 RepID=UPI001CBE1A1E|nr:DUF4307 domain-containing protein [Leifsonia poae]
MAVTETIDRRYGRSPNRKRRDRWWLIGAALAFVAVFTAWVFWAGWDNDQADLEATDTAYNIVDAHHVEITFTLNTSTARPVTCAVQALNEDFAIVGWRIVSFPATETRVTTHSEMIRTTEPSNTGLISSCWLS